MPEAATETGQQTSTDSQQQTAAPAPNVIPAAPPTPAPTPAAQQEPAGEPRHEIDELPDWAQKIIRDTRDESRRYRQGSETAAAQAADKAKKELAQTIGKALGLVEDASADPAKLAEQAATAASETAQARRELAVFKAASKAGADPAQLLDSMSFLESVAKIDPNDSDAVAAAVKVAVDSNPAFRTAQTASVSTVSHAGGSGEGAVTPEQFKAMGYGERVALYQSNKALYEQLAAATIK